MSHLYRILGVPQTCSDEELKKAFQKKALLWHPDRQPDETRRARAEHMFKEISTSYNRIVQLRESGQDAMAELHQAEQAYRHQYRNPGFQHGGRAGNRHPGAGGAGNEHRDWQAHRAAYDKANRGTEGCAAPDPVFLLRYRGDGSALQYRDDAARQQR